MGGSVSRADAAAPPLPVGMPPAAAPLLAQQAPKARSHNTLTHTHAGRGRIAAAPRARARSTPLPLPGVACGRLRRPPDARVLLRATLLFVRLAG
jgi:hypothetical protein